ncbi:MAG: hypothetical protein DRN25_03680 [Thermoplasmata archaeon]|nr:MAG: hypothetical protein DRN25_03680 [Thermoplasmata archaeon]
MPKEKVLFNVKDLYFSLDYKRWEKAHLTSTDANVWIKCGRGWKKFPNDELRIVQVKSAARNYAVLILMRDNRNMYLGGKKPTIYTLYNALMSVLPTTSESTGIKFTDTKRLVLKALYQGVRRPENIMPLINREYDEIVKILEEFQREGICTKAGILTEKGKLIMMEEGYK